jgi:hypothetical protein
MPDAMSSAELAGQYVELLPARTVLSLLQAGTDGIASAPGEQGDHGSNGASIPGTTMWALFGSYYPSESGSTTSSGIGDASSTTLPH